MTRQRTKGLPAVGTLDKRWGVSMGNQLTAVSAVSESENTVVSVAAWACACCCWNRKRRTSCR